MLMFVRFIVDVLLTKGPFEHISVFAFFLNEVEGVYAGSLNRLAKAILELANAPLDGNDPISTDGMNERMAHKFRSSALYVGFLRARFTNKFNLLKANTSADNKVRLKDRNVRTNIVIQK